MHYRDKLDLETRNLYVILLTYLLVTYCFPLFLFPGNILFCNLHIRITRAIVTVKSTNVPNTTVKTKLRNACMDVPFTVAVNQIKIKINNKTNKKKQWRFVPIWNNVSADFLILGAISRNVQKKPGIES